MKNVHTLKGVEVENLITKFYYKDNHLCFQILLECGLNKKIAYKEYSDYSEYKSAFNQLMEMKSLNKAISLPSTKQNLSYMSLT